MTKDNTTKEWKFRSLRQHEPMTDWLDIQYRFIRQYLKHKKDFDISLVGECWVFFDPSTNETFATIDNQKGETLVY